MQKVSYLMKFGEWPSEQPTVNLKGNEIGHISVDVASSRPQPLKVEKGVSDSAQQPNATIVFGEPGVQQFSTLLIENWVGIGFHEICSMLQNIADGRLRPEFEIPRDKEALRDWLSETEQEDSSKLRETRNELREIARTNSEAYATGTIAAQP